jgi:hypothetical protein
VAGHFASGRSGVLILADSSSGTPPAAAFVRKKSVRPPSLPGNAG